MRTVAKTGSVNHSRHAHAWAPAALASMGVVFGDIGTSPLYALSVAVKATNYRTVRYHRRPCWESYRSSSGL